MLPRRHRSNDPGDVNLSDTSPLESGQMAIPSMSLATSKIERLSARGKIVLSAASQTVSSAVVAVGAVAVVRITTHALGPSNYGLFALIIIYVNLVSTFADLGITSMTTRNLARPDANQPLILSVTLSSRMALSLLAIPIINITAALLYPHESHLFRVSLAIMSCDVLVATLQTTAGAAFAVRIRGDLLALMNGSSRILYLIGIVLTTLFHGSYLGYICAYVGADVVVGITAIVSANRSIPLRWNSNIRAWLHSAGSAIPLGGIQVAGSIYTWVDSILLSTLRSSVELGFYSIAINVINLAGTLPGFLMQALIPSLVNAESHERERLLNRAAYVLFCIGAPLAAGGIVLRTDIVVAIAGPRFLPATTPLAILLVTLPVSFVQMTLGYTSVAIDRYRPLVAVVFGMLFANIGANLILIPRYGPKGAAWALLGSEILSLLFTYLVFRLLTGMRVHWVSLWRPAVASCAVLFLAAARGHIWSHQNRLNALLVGGAIVLAVYFIVLFLVRGIPEEFRRVKGKHRRRGKFWA
jgi:O-antigen/teichoic acid export membrane protein